MTEIKALDELRRIAEQMDAIAAAQSEHGFSPGAIKIMNAVEHLEAEIAERFMELPVDADGVPIHCGEHMRLDNGHEGEVWLIGVFDIMMSDHTCFDWAKSRHVRPRRVEDVLRECGKSYYAHMTDNYMNYDGTDDQLIAKYAAEIREMMKDVS